MSIFNDAIVRSNPGAYTFLKESCMIDVEKTINGFNRMLENEIVGSMLYVIWNDCCYRDTEWAMDVILNNSIEDILKHINNAHLAVGNRGIPYGKK